MAKHWKEYVSKAPSEQTNVESGITWKEILDENDSLRALMEEKERLEKELKSYTGHTEDNSTHRNYHSEIPSVYEKKKEDRLWSNRRNLLSQKRKENGRPKPTRKEKEVNPVKKRTSSKTTLKSTLDTVKKNLRRSNKLDSKPRPKTPQKQGLSIQQTDFFKSTVIPLETNRQEVSEKTKEVNPFEKDERKKKTNPTGLELEKTEMLISAAKKVNSVFKEKKYKALTIDSKLKEYASKSLSAIKQEKSFEAIEKLKIERLFKKDIKRDKKMGLDSLVRSKKKVDEWQKKRDNQKKKKRKDGVFTMSI